MCVMMVGAICLIRVEWFFVYNILHECFVLINIMNSIYTVIGFCTSI